MIRAILLVGSNLCEPERVYKLFRDKEEAKEWIANNYPKGDVTKGDFERCFSVEYEDPQWDSPDCPVQYAN